MKKITSLVLVIMLLIASITPVMANNNITVKIDGQQIAFDVQPQLINSRTMVPLRAIFEALGATVDWNDGTQTVTSTKDGTTISLTINNPEMYVNGAAVTLDTPACLVGGRTLVPVRAISEAFGTSVEWDGATSTVLISSPIIYSGHGDSVISNVNIPFGNYCTQITSEADSYFSAKLYYDQNSSDYNLLANGADPYKGITLYTHARKAKTVNGMIQVEAKGDWTIKIFPVTGTTTTNIVGHGEMVTGKFVAKTSRNVFNVTHNADSYFSVKLYPVKESSFYKLIANSADPYSGSSLDNLNVGEEYFFVVEAEGDWTIDMGLGDAITTYDSRSIVVPGTYNDNNLSSNNDTALKMYDAFPEVPDFGAFANISPINTGNKSTNLFTYRTSDAVASKGSNVLRDYSKLLIDLGYKAPLINSNDIFWVCEHPDTGVKVTVWLPMEGYDRFDIQIEK